MYKYGALALLAVSLTGGLQYRNQAQSGPPHDDQYVEIVKREVTTTEDKTILHVTFKNKAPGTLKLDIKKLDLNLYEPLSTLPLTAEIRPNGSTTIDLEYPRAAGDKKSGKELELVNRRRHPGDPQGPCLNYNYDASFFTTESNGRSGIQFVEMMPCVIYIFPDTDEKSHLVRCYIENTAMPRTIEVRMNSITAGETKELDAPVTLLIAPGAKVEVPSRAVSEGIKKDLQFEYEYRLKPNKTWIKATSHITEQHQ